MIPRQASGPRTRLRRALRRASTAAACLLAAQVLPSPVRAGETPQIPPVAPASTSGLAAPQAMPGPDDARSMLRAAVALADGGELERAGNVLSAALDRWPDHPELLAGLAGLRFRQGRLAEAEVLAARLTRLDPVSRHGWELLGASRYLQDDARGALRAWRHARSPVVREMEVRVLAHHGPRASDRGAEPVRLTGIAVGRSLTVEELVRGERRLAALPAARSSRLGYRALSGGDAAIEGTVVLGASNPTTLPHLAAHAVRLLVGRRIHIVSSDPLRRLERWELSGAVEGSLHSVALVLAHPAPSGPGVWRWAAEHGTGRYATGHSASGRPASGGDEQIARERHTGIAFSHADWITASLQGSAHARIDVRPGRGKFAGAGMALALLPLTGRGSVRVEGTGWTKVGEAASGGEGPTVGAAPAEEATWFGRVALLASLDPPHPPGVTAPSGVALRGGLVAVSAGAPRDLLPRIGAGGNTSVLMRARSDLDGEGVVRPLFPGRTWAHGGVEVRRGVASVGPVGIGVAAFADGVRALTTEPGLASSDGRRGAVHLGAGLRARIPWVAGWFRADWGIDPVDGASTISAAWVPEGAS